MCTWTVRLGRTVTAAPIAAPPTDHAAGKPVALPFASIGADFKGRAEFLRELHACLHRAEGARAAISSGAISGMGGIGKTCAAVEYAWEYRGEYTALLFATAESADTLDRDLAKLAHPLSLPEAAATDAGQQKDAVLRWLNANPGWLLILDNIDTPEALRAVQALLGFIAGGHVLLTGRLSRFGAGAAALELGLLDLDAATAMLLERTPHRRKMADDATRARELAEHELDRLPLALEHAAALIEHLGCGFADYRERLRSTPRELLDRQDLQLTHYDRAVFRTWLASAALLTPSSRALLERLSFLAPDPLPDFLFDVPLLGANTDNAREALAGLTAYSLVRRETDPPRLVVHRLVQDVARLSLDATMLRQRLTEVLGWVSEAFAGDPQDVRAWDRLDPLAPHADVVAAHADAAGITDPTGRLMSELGRLFQAKALHARAEPLVRRALAIGEASLGKDHPTVAIYLSNLATLLYATNRLGEAEPLMRRALAIDEASLGKDHPSVAVALSNLAVLLQDTNRLGEAEPLMRRALDIAEASLGKDHPNVAIGLNVLARLLQATNRHGEAEPLLRRAIAIGETSYGEDHPEVAVGYSNLAALLQATNRLGEAEPLMRRHLAIFLAFQRDSGHPHPHRDAAIGNYSRLLAAMGRSETEIAAAIAKMKRQAGLDQA
ncbi:MAG TPA: tetratricopeptide repeat protein [Acetobacteraceae bacterium]|nr:tetratricopeptide repeat protein [Acetobacteraceae bacterium]